MSKRVRFSAVDLFCGCGGLSLGLRRAAFNVVAAIDNDHLCTSTYGMNHKTTHLVEEDIRTIDPSALMVELGLAAGDLDLMAGCPPCQGFSTLRTLNGSRDVDEPMNELISEFVRFVRIFRPKALMMENVPALSTDARLDRILCELLELGYVCRASLFDAVNFGVPQRRIRMIMIGSVYGVPAFAAAVRRRRTVGGAIRRLPSPHTTDDPVHNYRVRRADSVVALMKRIPKDGGSRTDLPVEDQLECHKGFDGFRDIYGRMAWRKPAPTITGGCINPSKGRYTHPEEDRAITVREAAVLQGFPRAYQIDMSQGRYPAAQMIGNAFPPKFAEHHASAIYRFLLAHRVRSMRTPSGGPRTGAKRGA